MQRLLGIHEALELTCRVIVLDVRIVLGLLLSSLLVSVGNGLIHLSLHLGGLQASLLDRQTVVVLGDLDCSGLSQKRHNKKTGSHEEQIIMSHMLALIYALQHQKTN